MASPAFRSGFAALIGRPNVGKSTQLNRLTGEKLAIVSSKPQTTRNRILGVVTRPAGQVAFLDTPGIHVAKGQLNRYMVDVALQALEEVDLALLLVSAEKKPLSQIDKENQYILEKIAASRKPAFLVINKSDQVQKPLLLPLIDLYRHQHPFAEIIPISALTGNGTDRLLAQVLDSLPKGEALYEADTLTDQPERAIAAEYIREQVFQRCRQEIPYATAVQVDVFDEAERTPRTPKAKAGKLAGLVRIAASIVVERESQKAIVVGKGAQMLKEIGTHARRAIERLLGTHVFLSLRVKVQPGWSERPEGLRKLGYE
jgi:GTP-binding protein Era